MTDEEWQHLYETFETTELLSAVDAVDKLRDDLNDAEGHRPPELRTNLLETSRTGDGRGQQRLAQPSGQNV